MRQFTEKEAIKLAESKFYEDLTYKEKVDIQLFQDRLLMPFDVFHEAMTKVLGRPVWTHEFAFRDELTKEYLGEKEQPTMEEIINLIPEGKRLIITNEQPND